MEAVDSVDFQFAVSVNENAGFFDIEQKGETWKQILYQQKEQRDKTIVDISKSSWYISLLPLVNVVVINRNLFNGNELVTTGISLYV